MRPYTKTLRRDLLQRSFPGLLHKYCPEGFCRERKHGDLIKRSCQRYLVQRSCQETSSRDLDRNLAKRSVTEILRQSSYRDLVQRSCQETSHGDLVQRLGEESGGLARRSCRDTLNRDLTLRSLAKILLHKSPKEPCADSLSQRSCAAVFIGRTCQGDLGTIFHRDLHTGNLQNHTWHLFFSLLGSLLSC